MMPREITGSCTVYSSRRGLSCAWTPAAPWEGPRPPPVDQSAAARSWRPRCRPGRSGKRLPMCRIPTALAADMIVAEGRALDDAQGDHRQLHRVQLSEGPVVRLDARSAAGWSVPASDLSAGSGAILAASLPSWTLRKDPRRCAASAIRVRDSRPRPPPVFFPVPLRASSFFLGGISALGGDGALLGGQGGPPPPPRAAGVLASCPVFAQLHIATMTAAAIGCLFCCFYFTLPAISTQRHTR